MNTLLVDIATNGLSDCLTRDGQSTMTGQIKGANGTLSLPSYSFASDLNTGFYRIGSDNIGVVCGATKILDISTTGLAVTGSLTPTGAFTANDGTVSLPGYSFASDLDSGIYRIGSNNLGIAVNATKILDISASGLNVIGTVSSNGNLFSPLPQGVVMVNGTITESHAGNAVTYAIKTLAGTDPSATDIVFFCFRNVTAATGNYTVVQLTAALSLVISSGSTLGYSSATAGRTWLVIFNDGGTLRLGAINCRSGVNVYGLSAWGIASSTAEGGAGGADSAQTFYTDSAVTSKSYGVIGYASYESGLTTAGNWDVAPTRLQLFGVDTRLPGEQVQVQQNTTGAVATGTTVVPLDDTIPQITEGDQFLTQAITPLSAANILYISSQAHLANNVGLHNGSWLFQDATANALTGTEGTNGANGTMSPMKIDYYMIAATTSSTTFRIRCGQPSAGTTTFNGVAAGRLFGGVLNSYLSVKEIMA